MEKITRPNFYRRSYREKVSLLEQAGSLLRRLVGAIPHDTFQSYIQAQKSAARRINDMGHTDRRKRNQEELRHRMLGRDTPSLPTPEPDLPEPEPTQPEPEPTAPRYTEQSARAAIRRIVNERALINQLSQAGIFVRPVRSDGTEIGKMVLRAPKKKAGDIQFVIPTESERSRPSYEREISFVFTLDRLTRVAQAQGIDVGLNSHLRGRGLRGAGKGVYQCVERRSRYYNLNDIRGTGLKSAFIYQPIGSKYIRVPDLDKNRLNIVYPSRKKLGPLRDISDSVKQMIKDLVYEGKLSQAAYDELSLDDKRLFREILQATHIQHSFKEKLPDPTDALRAEYDKLRGELHLGNDNPSVVAQMKSLVVDMYANRLISDKEFKQVISSLI